MAISPQLMSGIGGWPGEQLAEYVAGLDKVLNKLHYPVIKVWLVEEMISATALSILRFYCRLRFIGINDEHSERSGEL